MAQITDMHMVGGFSRAAPRPWPKRSVHLESCVGRCSLAKSVHPIILRLFNLRQCAFHSPLSTQKPHSWPNMAWSHQSDASSGNPQIQQRYHRGEQTPTFVLVGSGLEQTLRFKMREARHQETGSVREKVFLFLVWSEATGTVLHSQVHDKNQHNPSALNGTQNHRPLSGSGDSGLHGSLLFAFFTLTTKWRRIFFLFVLWSLSLFTKGSQKVTLHSHFTTCPWWYQVLPLLHPNPLKKQSPNVIDRVIS